MKHYVVFLLCTLLLGHSSFLTAETAFLEWFTNNLEKAAEKQKQKQAIEETLVVVPSAPPSAVDIMTLYIKEFKRLSVFYYESPTELARAQGYGGGTYSFLDMNLNDCQKQDEGYLCRYGFKIKIHYKHSDEKPSISPKQREDLFIHNGERWYSPSIIKHIDEMYAQLY